MKYLIKNGRVIDPRNNIDDVLDILISDSSIERVGKNISDKSAHQIDAKGKMVVPGLIDMHVHLREPGREDKETIRTGTRAAIKGGVTSVLAMPNTEPAIDSPAIVRQALSIIKDDAMANVYISAAITKGRSGADLVDITALKKEGVIALSDDGSCPEDAQIVKKALTQCKKEGILLIEHCEDKKLSGKGVINEGYVATKLGLRSISKASEYMIVEREINIAKELKCRVHIAHVSAKESVDAVRKAKKEGVMVSAETAPHYFTLTDECCVTYDTNTKMNPPLRSKEDLQAIQAALKDGTIDVIASDHAPHGKHDKEVEFDYAAFGIIGLETSLALAVMGLVEPGIISWQGLVRLMSANPARILGLDKKGHLGAGADADITIIDPAAEWVYKEDKIESKSKNSPFINWKFKSRVTDVMRAGKLVLKNCAFC